MNGVSIFTTDLAKYSSLAILGTACFVCQEIPDELMRCQKCKRMSYCSAACRAEDFESHEMICSLLQLAPTSTSSSKRREIFEREDPAHDLELDISLLFTAQDKTFREMMVERGNRVYTRAHRDLLLYEPRCAICLRSADDMRTLYDPEYNSLLHCPDCRAAFACSEDHRAQYRDEHSQQVENGEGLTECEMNKRAYEYSLEIVARGWTPMVTLWFPMRRRTEYSPLPSSWQEWFADPSNLSPPDSSQILNKIRTRQLSIPMSILHGMELFDKADADLSSLLTRTELEIVVLGAMEYELLFDGSACFEELLHNLPSVRRLILRFVGPNVRFGMIGPDGTLKEALDWDLCTLCKEKGVELKTSTHPDLYHEYVKERIAQAATGDGPAFEWPDIAVLFNSGLSLNYYKAEWSPTLDMLAESGVPTLCSSFLERESVEDESCLESHRCNIVIKRHKNPWRSEVLMKMVLTRKQFFTYNGFIQGFRGLKERG
ncbi:hypothetical protein SCHPADRAFT_906729 [Schizopora paradoxa]|uniref:MYND-type domain-containing protein n=1 Tax=Schizopora paradoxa TaxID=27342 RepID=A0A0H2RM94_9AGAM|nr:hypothetical protein SCHPADRAFT_906729 [Schizopora paradoxa]